MSDESFIREVDEDLRRERMKALWDTYGWYIVGVCVLIIAITAGYRGWEYWQTRQAAIAGDEFMTTMGIADEGNSEETVSILEAYKDGANSSYEILASFRAASALANAGKTEEALKAFTELGRDASLAAPYQDLARIRAGYLAIESESYEEISARLGDLTQDGSSYRNAALEVMGLSAFENQDYESARKHLKLVAADSQATAGMRQRAEIVLSLIDGYIGAETTDENS